MNLLQEAKYQVLNILGPFGARIVPKEHIGRFEGEPVRPKEHEVWLFKEEFSGTFPSRDVTLISPDGKPTHWKEVIPGNLRSQLEGHPVTIYLRK